MVFAVISLVLQKLKLLTVLELATAIMAFVRNSAMPLIYVLVIHKGVI